MPQILQSRQYAIDEGKLKALLREIFPTYACSIKVRFPFLKFDWRMWLFTRHF
jgi:hypothetical protein